MAAMTSTNPISDLMYDWLTVLQSKAEGLNAYEKYIQDAEEAGSTECVEMFRRLHEQDARMTEEVKDHIFAFLEQSHISEKNVAHLERIAKLSSRKLPASPRLFWMSPALSRTKLEESTSLPRSIRNCWASCATPV